MCQLYLATLYKQNTSNLQLIKDVYLIMIPENHANLKEFQSQADFKMKLRRVFARWAHDVLGARKSTNTSTATAAANTDARIQLHATGGISDKLYCFFSSVHRTFFHHNSRQPSGNRRRPICAGFPDSVIKALKGDDNQARRLDLVVRWNAIGKKIRNAAAVLIPSLLVERAGLQITTKVYCALSSVSDILHHSSFEDDQQIESWSAALIDDVMKDNAEIDALEKWLFQEVKEDKMAKLPSVSSTSSTSSSSVDAVDVARQQKIVARIEKESQEKATQATRQLIRSTINLRMKQVLRADKLLSCGNHEQTFRAVIAVLGGSQMKMEPGEQGGKKTTRKRKRKAKKGKGKGKQRKVL